MRDSGVSQSPKKIICRKEAMAMHRFDYSFLDNGMVPAGLLNITADIYSLRVLALDRKERFIDVFTACSHDYL